MGSRKVAAQYCSILLAALRGNDQAQLRFFHPSHILRATIGFAIRWFAAGPLASHRRAGENQCHMAIAVRCITCGKVAQVRDELGGRKAKCTCGAVISVPLPPKPKACASCGVDITRTKRMKDEE